MTDVPLYACAGLSSQQNVKVNVWFLVCELKL